MESTLQKCSCRGSAVVYNSTHPCDSPATWQAWKLKTTMNRGAFQPPGHIEAPSQEQHRDNGDSSTVTVVCAKPSSSPSVLVTPPWHRLDSCALVIWPPVPTVTPVWSNLAVSNNIQQCWLPSLSHCNYPWQLSHVLKRKNNHSKPAILGWHVPREQGQDGALRILRDQ